MPNCTHPIDYLYPPTSNRELWRCVACGTDIHINDADWDEYEVIRWPRIGLPASSSPQPSSSPSPHSPPHTCTGRAAYTYRQVCDGPTETTHRDRGGRMNAMFNQTPEPMNEHVQGTDSRPLRFDMRFPYATCPVSMNHRVHWARKAQQTRDVRRAAAWAAQRIPEMGRCEVALTWYVTDRRRRDADNAVATLKALCDGIVDAGVVQDDTPEYMTKHMPIIQWIPKTQDVAHMVLTITQIGKDAA